MLICVISYLLLFICLSENRVKYFDASQVYNEKGLLERDYFRFVVLTSLSFGCHFQKLINE